MEDNEGQGEGVHLLPEESASALSSAGSPADQKCVSDDVALVSIFQNDTTVSSLPATSLQQNVSGLDFCREHPPHNPSDWCHFKSMTADFKPPPSTAQKCSSFSYKLPSPFPDGYPTPLASSLQPPSLSLLSVHDLAPHVTKEREPPSKATSFFFQPQPPFTQLPLWPVLICPGLEGAQDMGLPVLKLP